MFRLVTRLGCSFYPALNTHTHDQVRLVWGKFRFIAILSTKSLISLSPNIQNKV
jgi:hypothetical protein